MFKKEVMKIRCTHQELFEKMFYFYFNNIKAKVDLDDYEYINGPSHYNKQNQQQNNQGIFGNIPNQQNNKIKKCKEIKKLFIRNFPEEFKKILIYNRVSNPYKCLFDNMICDDKNIFSDLELAEILKFIEEKDGVSMFELLTSTRIRKPSQVANIKTGHPPFKAV